MAVTIKDIAKEAGVSQATVSLVLNNRSQELRISQKTREKVLKAIQKKGYVPNLHVRSILGQNTYTIGLILPTIEHPIIAAFVDGARDQAAKAGYHIIISLISNDAMQDRYYLNNFIARRLSGIIASTEPTKEMSQELIKMDKKCPLVLFGNFDTSSFDTVASNSEEGVFMVTKYLIDRGHKRIAFCTGYTHCFPSKQKYKGYVRALQECGLKLNKKLYIKVERTDVNAGEEVGKMILSMNEKPDGIVFHNDEMAAGAMSVLMDGKIRIPEDISITGFDNMPLSKSLRVPLTTVSYPLYHIGQQAVKLLLDRIDFHNDKDLQKKQKEAKQAIRLSPELVIRSSVR